MRLGEVSVELRRPDDLPRLDGETVFRAPRWSAVVLAFVLGVVGLAWIAAAVGQGWWIGWIFGAPCALLAWPLAVAARRGFTPDNWVLRHGDQGLALKLRSHLNRDLPRDDRVVLWIPTDEVLHVRLVRQRRALPDAEGTTTQTLVDLEIACRETPGLAAADAELEAALARERDAPRRGRTHYAHYPLERVAPGVLRVGWRGRPSCVRGRPRKALALLGRTLPMLEELDAGQRDARLIDDAQAAALVRELVREGDQLAALRLLRARTGCGLREARELLERIRRPPSAA